MAQWWKVDVHCFCAGHAHTSIGNYLVVYMDKKSHTTKPWLKAESLFKSSWPVHSSVWHRKLCYHTSRQLLLKPMSYNKKEYSQQHLMAVAWAVVGFALLKADCALAWSPLNLSHCTGPLGTVCDGSPPSRPTSNFPKAAENNTKTHDSWV